ncbi:hypothetical protein NC652_030528 [Populus alba x Populus x berolinensis]|uniref:Defensin-like domain-containing protein n=1 Tax=Populus alba x Populus x berolinensis TaxID=444605 RepID=A0AAD6LYN8_9ROSI|nr:hypothetical protein NC652_030528 [Populus alba x Populus x berolinensis]KAJ6974177.1 hypothetical protein NC653_030300 [Populus alba x Populus x berolinensis]KAJ6974183.1 hypothetical protein NC653_030306 [Populus alba x Populus x berolinensis]KAJ6974190.1 hypothetical protein NC653_030312 [Populus alba x Populus x berolinensis]
MKHFLTLLAIAFMIIMASTYGEVEAVPDNCVKPCVGVYDDARCMADCRKQSFRSGKCERRLKIPLCCCSIVG